MATSQTEIREKVRTITDYDQSLLSDSDLDGVIDLAEAEVRSDLDNPSKSFYQGTDTYHIDLAIMWLSCLFAKVKAGEIGGINIELGELRATSLTGDASLWMAKFERRLQSGGDTRGYGSTTISRDSRSYGDSY